jgi:hypothetical protein
MIGAVALSALMAASPVASAASYEFHFASRLVYVEDHTGAGSLRQGGAEQAVLKWRVLEGELDLRDFELGLVLHGEPTGWGELQARALTVEDRQDSALTDLISRRLAGIGLRGAARKNSEISHAQESGMKAGPKRPVTAEPLCLRRSGVSARLTSRGGGCRVERRSDPLLRAPLLALFFDQLQSVVDELLPAALVQRFVDRKELGRSHALGHDRVAFAR